MSVELEGLGAAERALIDALAELLDRPPEMVLEAVFTPPEAAGLVATTLVEGRFTRLSLRVFGPRLRWASGERDLELPLAGLDRLEELDVTELELDVLDLSTLWRLTRLECSGNRLKQLDLEGCPSLTTLACAANDLMVLELRHLEDLGSCDCGGNALTAVVVPSTGRLRTLRAGRNQIMVLELGTQPELTELVCTRNALVQLTVDAPRLRVLEAGDNELTEIDVARFPRLQRLAVPRNRLGTLAVQSCVLLRELDCERNYLDALALGRLDRLEAVDVSHNQLERLDLGRCPALIRLDCSGNHLRALDLGDCPALRVLHCSANGLTALGLDGAPALCELRADGNALTALALHAVPRLALLDVGHNPLTTLDLRGNRALARLTFDGGPEILATSTQRRLLPLLRAADGLQPPGRDPGALDRFALHVLASTYDEPDREARFLASVRDAGRCARGTAVMLYWMASPHYYLQFDGREEVPRYALPGWDLIEAVQDRVRDGAYAHDDLPFDPRDDQQTVDPGGRDWTRDPAEAGQARKRSVPAYMLRPCGVGA